MHVELRKRKRKCTNLKSTLLILITRFCSLANNRFYHGPCSLFYILYVKNTYVGVFNFPVATNGNFFHFFVHTVHSFVPGF